MPTITLRHDGVAIARRERYRLTMNHRAAAPRADGRPTVEATSEDFDALLDLRCQLVAVGYSFCGLEPVT